METMRDTRSLMEFNAYILAIPRDYAHTRLKDSAIIHEKGEKKGFSWMDLTVYSKDLPRPRRRMHIGRNPPFCLFFFAHSHAAPRRTAQPTRRAAQDAVDIVLRSRVL